MFGVSTNASLMCLMAALNPVMAQTSAQRPSDRQTPAKALPAALLIIMTFRLRAL